VGGADGDHRRTVEEQGERVRVGGGPQGQASVRETFTRGNCGNAEDPPVGGEVTRRELCQGLKGVAPRQAGAKRVQEGVESRWLLVRWEVPEYAGGQE
jgi:hypothetical protein